MSSYEDSSGGWFCWVIWIGVMCLLCSSCDVNQSLKDYFSNSIKQETWVKATKGIYKYSKEFDRDWIRSVVKDTEVKVKLRDPLDKDSNKMDFVCEMSTKLVNPVLSDPNKYEEVSYGIYFDFKFIDEDGFIIRTFSSSWFNAEIKNEDYKRSDLRHIWGNEEEEHTTLKVLIKNLIDKEIAKKTVKIVYETEILIWSKKLKNK